MRILSPVPFLIGLTLFSCATGKEGASYLAGSFVIEGTMQFMNLETGCWLLIAEDGKRYEPAGEDLSMLWHDGLSVVLRVRTMKGVASICQAGQTVEVLQILKTGEM